MPCRAKSFAMLIVTTPWGISSKEAVRKHEQIRDLVAANMFNKDKKDAGIWRS
jgi:hypothetical protein